MTKKVTASIDLLLPSAKIIKDNLPTFFLLLVIPMLLSSITGPQVPLSEQPTMAELLKAIESMITPYMIAGSILSLLFYPLLTFAQWQAGSGKQITVKESFTGGMKRYWQLLGLLVLMTVIIVAGFVALIIPGIIFLRCFILSPFYMLQYKLGIIESLKKSAEESKPYKWQIYGVLGVTALFGLLSSFGVVGQICGTIMTVLYSVALSLRFHEIKKLQKSK